MLTEEMSLALNDQLDAESEALFSEPLTQINRIGDPDVGLFGFDRKLTERTPDTPGSGA